jgi:hypothetical protein
LFAVQLLTSTRFGRVVKKNSRFNPGTGPASKWRDVQENVLLHIQDNVQENIGDDGQGRSNDGCLCGQEEQVGNSLDEPDSSHYDSDSDDSDKTVPLSPLMK